MDDQIMRLLSRFGLDGSQDVFSKTIRMKVSRKGAKAQSSVFGG
jgi:hypothetical protein